MDTGTVSTVHITMELKLMNPKDVPNSNEFIYRVKTHLQYYILKFLIARLV